MTNLTQLRFKKCSALLFLIVFTYYFEPIEADLISGFSQGCYSTCPKKIWNMEDGLHEQANKQWLNCLKDCHQANSQILIILIVSVLLIIVIICLLIYIFCGEQLRQKYMFHVQRNKRIPIYTNQQSKIKTYEQSLKNFQETIKSKTKQVFIQFENDNNARKRFYLQEVIFSERKNKILENFFFINLINLSQNLKLKQQEDKQKKNTNQQNTQDQLCVNNQVKSQLIGAVTYTSKGLNIWWVKIDDKPIQQNRKCKFCQRRNQKFYSVYQKDPYAPENSIEGNIVLQDSSKQSSQRYTKYFIKINDRIKISTYQEKVIET